MDYKVGDFCSISKNAIIENGVIIGNRVTVHDNVTIKKGTFIGDDCVIGEPCYGFYKTESYQFHKTIIGKNSIIRSKTIIYENNVFGEKLETGHGVTIREKTQIGNNVRIGTLSDLQGYCKIGDYVRLHSNVHIGQKSQINSYVWIFPYVILTNDPTPPSETMKGVCVDEFAVIATGSILLPGIKVGKNALVAAGAIVTKDVLEERVVLGNPARDMCSIFDLNVPEDGKFSYPWPKYFKRGMPWENYDSYDEWHIKMLSGRKQNKGSI